MFLWLLSKQVLPNRWKCLRGDFFFLIVEIKENLVDDMYFHISRRLTIIWKRYIYRKNVEDGEEKTIYTRWEQDYNLQNIDQLDLVDEYLEMVIQYGFITLFVAGKLKNLKILGHSGFSKSITNIR